MVQAELRQEDYSYSGDNNLRAIYRRNFFLTLYYFLLLK